jgi:cell pole-organizing protein PopZ
VTFIRKYAIMVLLLAVHKYYKETDMRTRHWAGVAMVAAIGGMVVVQAARAQSGMAQAAAPVAATTAAAAATTAAITAAAPVPARPADVATVDGIVAALYDVISGTAGQPRDWDRMRSLFAPEGRLMAVGARPEGAYALRAMSVDDYITRNSKAFATMGFFEREAARSTETFGQIVHVFSTYESRHARGDAEPFQRGINSIQLVNDGKRWWIVNVLWRAEDASLRLPERYLPRR